MIDEIIEGQVLIVGSSMGGWIGLLLAKAKAERVKGFIGIAAAPDFTMRLYEDEFTDEHRACVESDGYVEIPSDYDEPYIFTKGLFEDGKQHLVLNSDHTHDYPITLFHGLQDDSVPKESSIAIREKYSGGALDIVFIEDGDHRLSRPQDLEMIMAEIVSMSEAEEL